MKSKGVFFNIPGHGHVNPTLAVVKELIEKGAVIDYYCTEEFREKIEATGANFRAMPHELLAESTLKNFSLLGFFADLLEATEVVMPYLLKEIKQQEYDYVLTDLFAVWGRLVAEQVALPIVVFCPCFAIRRGLKDPPNSKLQMLGTPIKTFGQIKRIGRSMKVLKETYTPYKIHQLDDFLVGDLELPCVVFTAKEFQPQIELFPDNYFFSGATINVHSTPRDESFPYDKLEKENRPIIYISLGSILSDKAFYQKCIQAFAETDYMVVMNISTQLRIEDFEAPDNFIICNYAPQLEVLSKASLFVTHGGMNSAHEGIYFEVPMLVIPQVSDQFMVAKAIHEQQLGIWLSKYWLTAAKLRKAAAQLMENKIIPQHLKKMNLALRRAGGYQAAAEHVQSLIQITPPFQNV